MKQIPLDFDRRVVEAYATVREFVGYRIHHQSKHQMLIAADMDLSPTTLTRKIAQSPGDRCVFKTDDLEKYIEKTGDKDPVFYLVEKYCTTDPELIQRQIEDLERQRDRLLDVPVRAVK